MSLRWQLMIAFGLVVLVALASVAVIAQTTAEREVESFLRHGGQVALENLSASLENYYSDQQSWSGVEALLSAGSGRGRGPRSGSNSATGEHTLADAQGVILFSAEPQRVGQTLTDAEMENAIDLRASGEVVGYLLPEESLPQYPQNFDTLLVARINRATLISALLSGLVAVVLAVVSAAIIQKPVKNLTVAVKNMSDGDLSQRVDIRGKGEIALLGDSFNHMAQSLQDAESRRKAMTADIAHELRNPLAVQRAQLEALQDGVYPLNQAQLESLYTQNQTLSRLVEDLRLLALADAGELALNRSKLNLTSLCQALLGDIQPQASAKHLTLQEDLPGEEVLVCADKERIQQIISNLLQNALRYAPPDGRIKLTLRQAKNTACIEVFNSGPQMSEETLKHLFERFYRGDRARDRAGGGTGLGLSIAKKLAEAHQGTLRGENSPAGGVIFILTLPQQNKH
jgi:signal transduction histidine kinase